MKFILKKTKRKKTENGFYFKEEPEVLCINTNNTDKKVIASIPFGKYHSPCEVRNNKCLPNTSLSYVEK